jgi:putative membrane protein
MAIKPYDRTDWALENVLVIFGVLFIAATCKKIPLSRISYSLVFIFLCLHVLGAHYTYALTPYDEWIQALFGFRLDDFMGFERNHYDRLIHLAYGLLLAYPMRELFIRVADVKGFWGYFLPLVITISSSAIYELLEWGVAEVFGGDLGIAYLGTQGDVWDAHKDMALASLGALIAMTITALINIHVQRDFAREWNDSLKIKRNQPLGEDEILRLWKHSKQVAEK